MEQFKELMKRYEEANEEYNATLEIEETEENAEELDEKSEKAFKEYLKTYTELANYIVKYTSGAINLDLAKRMIITKFESLTELANRI